MYEEETVRRLGSSSSIVIYGAGKIAQTVYYCMIREPYCLKIESFLVSDTNGNPDSVDGIPVILAKDWVNTNSLVLIAVMDGFLEDIQNSLKRLGFTNILCVTFESDLWAQLRGNYFREVYRNTGMKFLELEQEIKLHTAKPEGMKKVNIYVVTSAKDRKTVMERMMEPWEIIIRAGAAFSEERPVCLCDDEGDNISKKNNIYCELTALYWIWKNDCSEYVGVSHYRRRFELDTVTVEGLSRSDIDVVLTIPVLNYPSVRHMYAENHCERDWNIMMEAIKFLYPEYYWTAEKLQDGNFYYGYNMMIAKRKVLEDYCKWLFTILSYCEEKCENKPRYLGHLAERLLGIYFLKNWDEYKIVHARRHFMSKELQ